MANIKKAVRKVKKAVKAVARVSPVELDPRKKGFLTLTARRGRLNPLAQAALTGIAGLNVRTGKGRGARMLPQKKLASKGTRGLPEQQEARRRRVSAALGGVRASGTPEAYQKMWKASKATPAGAIGPVAAGRKRPPTRSQERERARKTQPTLKKY